MRQRIHVSGRRNRVTVQASTGDEARQAVASPGWIADVGEFAAQVRMAIGASRELPPVAGELSRIEELVEELEDAADPAAARSVLQRIEAVAAGLALGAAGNGVWEVVKVAIPELVRQLR